MAFSRFFDFGVLTGFFLFGLGTSGAALSDWRKERGLWMLAVLLFVIFDSIYLILCVEEIIDIWR